MAVNIDTENCIGCEACVDECPFGALEMNDDDCVQVDGDICIECGICIDACSNGVLEI